MKSAGKAVNEAWLTGSLPGASRGRCLGALVLLIGLTTGAWADDTPPYSVKLYLATAEQWVNREIVLQVSHLRMARRLGDGSGQTVVELHTAWGYYNGGKILAIMHEDDFPAAQKRYGGAISRVRDSKNTPYYKTAPLKGILRPAQGGGFFLDIPKGTNQGALDAAHPPPYVGK